MQSRDLIIPSDSSEQSVIDLWLRLKRSPQTQRAYKYDIDVFRSFVKKPLASVTLEDALNFVDALNDLEITNKRGITKRLEDNSKRRMINAVKSLYSFAYDSGFFHVNVFRAIKPPSAKDAISQHILSENDVIKMIVLERNSRDHAILHTLYASGLRVSELCALQWKHVVRRETGCQLDVMSGKGDKQRHVLLRESSWEVINALRTDTTTPDDFVFASRQAVAHKGDERVTRLDPSQVFRIVKEAAKRAGIPNWEEISPHWLRHCHGSHAIDRKAPITVVRDTLGHASIATTNKYAHSRPDTSSAHYLPL